MITGYEASDFGVKMGSMSEVSTWVIRSQPTTLSCVDTVITVGGGSPCTVSILQLMVYIVSERL